MPIIESPGYNETEYNENGENENENESGEYNENESGEYNENESGEYNDGNGENENEYNDSDAPELAATSSLVVITAASRPRGIGAWLAHVERERRGSSILARLRSLVF
jgi:hypothetical protein